MTSAVPPTSTSTAGTGLAIVCTSKTSNLVQSTTNLKMCNRTKSILRGVWFPHRRPRQRWQAASRRGPHHAKNRAKNGAGYWFRIRRFFQIFSYAKNTLFVFSCLQRDPNRIAKKNGCHMAPGFDIFSQLSSSNRANFDGYPARRLLRRSLSAPARSGSEMGLVQNQFQ